MHLNPIARIPWATSTTQKKLSPKIALHFKVLCESAAMLPFKLVILKIVTPKICGQCRVTKGLLFFEATYFQTNPKNMERCAAVTYVCTD